MAKEGGKLPDFPLPVNSLFRYFFLIEDNARISPRYG